MTIIFRLHECVILIALAVIGSTSTSVGLVIVKSGVKVSWCRIKFKKKHKSEQMSGHAMLTCCSIWCISLNLWPSNLKKKLTSHMEKTLKGLLLHWFLMLSGLDGFVLVVVDYLQQFTLL